MVAGFQETSMRVLFGVHVGGMHARRGVPDGMPPARAHARRDWNKITCRWAFNQLYEATYGCRFSGNLNTGTFQRACRRRACPTGCRRRAGMPDVIGTK